MKNLVGLEASAHTVRRSAHATRHGRPTRGLTTVVAAIALASLVSFGAVSAEAKGLPSGYQPNGCTLSPDRGYFPVYYDFKNACNRHDYCYDELWFGGGETGRHRCDNLFHDEMRAWCGSFYGAWWQASARTKCFGVAAAYYGAVRNFGRDYFDNPWKN